MGEFGAEAYGEADGTGNDKMYIRGGGKQAFQTKMVERKRAIDNRNVAKGGSSYPWE